MENNCQHKIVYSAILTLRNGQEPRQITTNLFFSEKNLEEYCGKKENDPVWDRRSNDKKIKIVNI